MALDQDCPLMFIYKWVLVHDTLPGNQCHIFTAASAKLIVTFHDEACYRPENVFKV